MALSATAIKNAKLQDKPYKLADGRGLYLLVLKSGKYWRYDYRFNGKRKTLALGVYPDITLARAREIHQEARRVLAQGIDPSVHKQAVKTARAESAENSFEVIAREWLQKFAADKADNTVSEALSRLEKNVFPWLGRRLINEITAPELLAVLHRIEDRGAHETAKRVRQRCGQVFRYAVATSRAERDPSQDLRGALTPPKSRHLAAITKPKEVGALLRAIDEFSGSFVTQCALRLAPYVFLRPGELRALEWDEVDLDAAEIRIKAERMKMREVHIVPLSSQALELLREIRALTGHGKAAKYVFPGERSRARPMSENTLNAALRRLGYTKEEMTAHGFRSMASTLLNEQGWPPDVIERQLAHAERNSVRKAYNRATYLKERRRMMQGWADYLGALKSGADRPETLSANGVQP